MYDIYTFVYLQMHTDLRGLLRHRDDKCNISRGNSLRQARPSIGKITEGISDTPAMGLVGNCERLTYEGSSHRPPLSPLERPGPVTVLAEILPR